MDYIHFRLKTCEVILVIYNPTNSARGGMLTIEEASDVNMPNIFIGFLFHISNNLSTYLVFWTNCKLSCLNFENFVELYFSLLDIHKK